MICWYCRRPTDGIVKTHERCRERNKRNQQRRRARTRATGRCTRCGVERAKPGCTTCPTCIALQSEATLVRIETRRMDGTCLLCAAAPSPGRLHCARHLDQMASRKASQRRK